VEVVVAVAIQVVRAGIPIQAGILVDRGIRVARILILVALIIAMIIRKELQNGNR
jgi:hypothetical protein